MQHVATNHLAFYSGSKKLMKIKKDQQDEASGSSKLVLINGNDLEDNVCSVVTKIPAGNNPRFRYINETDQTTFLFLLGKRPDENNTNNIYSYTTIP